MKDDSSLVSDAFKVFQSEAPEFAAAWGAAIRGLAQASALDSKARELAYLSVMAALNRTSGIAFHVKSLKAKGATREEVISAILVGLPLAGQIVTQSLPAAVAAYDAD